MNKKNPIYWNSNNYSKNLIADYKPFNCIDGEGIRNSIYVSGCLFNCKGCYNKKIQNFNYGYPLTKKLENSIINDLSKEYVQGISFLGGEPFLNTNLCLNIIKKISFLIKNFKKDIWIWTGYTFEEILKSSKDKINLLNKTDILIDGRFDIKKKKDLKFRGSYNQRIINVKKTLLYKKIIILK